MSKASRTKLIPGLKRKFCPVPNCGRTYVVDPKIVPLCTYHVKLTQDMVWITQNVSVAPKPTSSLISAASKEAMDIMKGGLKP